MKRIILLLSLSQFVLSVASQVTIGSSNKPNIGTILDLKETDNEDGEKDSTRGLSLPKVKLFEIDQLHPMFEKDGTGYKDFDKAEEDSKHVGLLVYNIGERGPVCPGLYVWIGERWKRLSPDDCDYYIKADPAELNFPGEAATAQNISLQSNIKWWPVVDPTHLTTLIESMIPWVNEEQAVADPDPANLSLTLQDNGIDEEARSFIFHVEGINPDNGSVIQTPITVNQAKGPASYLRLNKSIASIAGRGGNVDVTVTSNIPWETEYSASNMKNSVVPSTSNSATPQGKTLRVNIAQNPAGCSERTSSPIQINPIGYDTPVRPTLVIDQAETPIILSGGNIAISGTEGIFSLRVSSNVPFQKTGNSAGWTRAGSTAVLPANSVFGNLLVPEYTTTDPNAPIRAYTLSFTAKPTCPAGQTASSKTHTVRVTQSPCMNTEGEYNVNWRTIRTYIGNGIGAPPYVSEASISLTYEHPFDPGDDWEWANPYSNRQCYYRYPPTKDGKRFTAGMHCGGGGQVGAPPNVAGVGQRQTFKPLIKVGNQCGGEVELQSVEIYVPGGPG